MNAPFSLAQERSLRSFLAQESAESRSREYWEGVEYRQRWAHLVKPGWPRDVDEPWSEDISTEDER